MIRKTLISTQIYLSSDIFTEEENTVTHFLDVLFQMDLPHHKLTMKEFKRD